MLRLSNGDGMISAARHAQQRLAHGSSTNPSGRISGCSGIGIDEGPAITSGTVPPASDVAEEMADQRLAAFVRIDPAEIEHERIAQLERVERRQIDRAGAGSRPQPMIADGRAAGARAATSVSSSGVRNRKPRGSAKKRLERVDVNQRILFRGRHQHRAVGDQRQAEVGVGVAIRPEQHAIVVAAVRAQVLEQPRRVRAVLAEPLLLLVRATPDRRRSDR